jgi:hypothetical protein
MVGVLVKRSTFGMNTFYAIHRQRLHELLWKQEVLRCAYALLWEGAEIVEPEPLPLEQLEDFLQQYGMAIDRRKEQIVVLQSDGGS